MDVFFFTKVAPSRLIFEILHGRFSTVLQEILEPKMLGRRTSFTQDRPSSSRGCGGPFERDIHFGL